jgi:steroid delta-isomerase-like uncharacterized protein
MGRRVPTTGKLLENLRSTGFDSGDFDVVVLTHVHPDHADGTVDAGVIQVEQQRERTIMVEHPLEANKALSRRIVEEAWNQHQPQAIETYYAAEYVNHQPVGGMTPDREGLKQWLTACIAGLPDLHLAIEEQVAEGDKVVTRWVAQGTHQGVFMGVAPSGRQVTVSGITIARVAGSQVVEEWANSDELGMLQQLGLIPAAPG